MAFRTQKATCAAILTALTLAPALAGRPELRYQVVHNHAAWREGSGVLVITEQDISYQEVSKKKKKKPEKLHHGRWSYQDIQQLYIAPQKLILLTYKDRKWLLGMDQQWEFRLSSADDFAPAYELLKQRLDQRLVAAFAEREFQPRWQIPVKLLGFLQGSEGTLEVGADRIVYRTNARNHSRTWRLRDIANVSSSGPFQLTLTTYERAKLHYGSMKDFNFQLKQPLEEELLDRLWRQLNQDQELRFLTSITERSQP